MNLQKNKIVTTITLTLILAISALLTSLPIVIAQENVTTYAFISGAPIPVGVNQEILITGLLNFPPPTAQGGWGDRWHGYSFEVTKPDGTTQTLGPYTSDPVGFAWTLYTVDQIGTYTFQFSFPGETLAGDNPHPTSTAGQEYIGVYFEPSTSEVLEVLVQEDPVLPAQDIPLPTGYWERPISAEFRLWGSISGSYLIPPKHRWALKPVNGIGPGSGHILWTRPVAFGGLVGGDDAARSYHDGGAYEGKMTPPIIINGILYYNEYPGSYGRRGFFAVDLRSGEELFYVANDTINFGQIYTYDSPNQHGAFAYLWRTQGRTWRAYDAFSGDWVFTIENAGRSSTSYEPQNFIFGPKGEVLVYDINTNDNWLALWNNTAIPALLGGSTGSAAWQWRPWGKTVDGKDGYIWNVTIPSGLEGSIVFTLEDRIIGSTLPSGQGMRNMPSRIVDSYSMWAISTEPGREGTLLWRKTYTNQDPDTILIMGEASLEDGVYNIFCSETRAWRGYDIDTGEPLWGPTESQHTWDMVYAAQLTDFAYGKFFSSGYGGILYAYDAQTGARLWETPFPAAGDAQFGENHPTFMKIVADGKIYVIGDEHSPTDPKERDKKIYAVDVETGEIIWDVAQWATPWSTGIALGDGILINLNTYDNCIYAFGKGPSATTVTAPEVAVTLGDSIMIKGTVTDQSPGAIGTPAIADDDIDDWMEYVYMQFPMPTDAKGVDVSIDVIDSNGNFRNIGTATSDLTGTFGYMWKPDIPGQYTIIATFAGSESYGASFAQTYLGVVEAPQQTPEPTSTPAPMTDTYIAGSTIAILAGIAIAVFLLLRKK
ncbi:MAG: outer membrane protein assembly factor BamB family protein [Promethearchaeota archaeon]